MRYKKNSVSLINIFLIVSLSGILVLRQGVSITWERYYVFDAIFIITLIVANMRVGRRWKLIKCNKFMTFIPLIMIFIWAYGIILGFVKGNNIAYVIRNNAGMLLYILFYFLINTNIRKADLSRGLEKLSFAIVIINLIGFFVINFASPGIISKYLTVPILNCLQIGGKLGRFQPVLHYGRDMIYICYGCSLWDALKKDHLYNKSTMKVLAVIFLVFVGMRSGGAELAILANSAIIVFTFLSKKMNKNVWTILMAVPMACLIFIASGKISLFIGIFSKKDVGNAVRYKQINYFLEHLNVFGHGFGADLSEIGRTYVMEISYVDLFYKVGIFSLIVFLIYAATIVRCIQYIKKHESKYSVTPLCAMSFIYSAFGNNVLFANSSVLLHIITLYYFLDVIKIDDEKIIQTEFLEGN